MNDKVKVQKQDKTWQSGRIEDKVDSQEPLLSNLEMGLQ